MNKKVCLTYFSLKSKFPSYPMNFCWGVWFVLAIIFTELMTNAPLSCNYNIWMYYFCGIIPLMLGFSEKEIASYNLFTKFKNPVLRTYSANIILILLGLFLPKIFLGVDLGFPYLCGETVLIIFWVWSIILTVIYDYKIWLLVAVAIYTNCLVYMYLLIHMSEVVSQTSIIYYMFTIGIVIISTILSALIYNRQIKKILKHCEDYDL